MNKRINKLFSEVQAKYGTIFEEKEQIEIRNGDLVHVISQLEEFSLFNTDRDVIADAFEELIGTAFRGGEGQFFTPRNVVQMMIEVLLPTEGERIIEPACGSGGFLAHILRHLIHTKTKNAFLVGIDKDLFLSRLAKIYLSLLGKDEFQVFCENSLEQTNKWQTETQEKLNSVRLMWF